MTIIYRDDIGYIIEHPDDDITFSDGIAIFDSNGIEVKIPITRIYLITRE